MKLHLISALLMGVLCATSMSASSPAYYGFAPHECAEEEITAVGSGANAFMEAAIRIDAAVDPLVNSMQGRRLLGVRCYLRADYKQKSKGYSCVRAYTGSLEGEVVSKTVNFLAGWNEVYFDEPVSIGESPVYVGYRVFETQGEPYPLAAYSGAQVPDVCYINPGRKGWIEDSSHGALLIEAIIDGDDAVFGNHVLVSPFRQPLVVAPDSDFECSIYVHNQSAVAVTDIEYAGFDADGNMTASHSLNLSEPLEPYGSVTVRGMMKSPSAEGSAVKLLTKAIRIDGNKADGCISSPISLYVSSDVFHRIPLIEEFTGLRCTNCPFMFYYLDMALEAFQGPHVYVAHHAGFYPDTFTKPCDESLLYLFGDGGPYNPAVMYDRRIMQGCNVPPMSATNVASTEPYDVRLAEAMLQPALAKVMVDSEVSADKATCRVYGKISKAALDFRDDLYVTAYLLEDNIAATGRLSQAGMDNIPEDAPADLPERFRHRGVIRHCFSAADNGDALMIDDNGNFDISFTDISPASDWNIGECEVVAFVHKVNTEDLNDNFVLNAGAARFNNYAENMVSTLSGASDPHIFVTPSRHIETSDPQATVEIHTLSGLSCNPASALPTGIYIVRWTCPDNSSGVRKIAVR